MTFWLISAAILVLAGALLAWPMMSTGARPKGLGMMLVVVFPVAGLMLYDTVGTPEALDLGPAPVQRAAQNDAHATGPGNEMNDLLLSLEQRLQENPDDIDGWMLLGRTYKSMQRYITAEASLRRAAELAPDNPLVKVELAEAMLYTSGQGEISDEVRTMLEQVIATDPNNQKGLWLLGIAETQAGNDARAIELWEQLLAQLEPGSGISASLEEQLAMARSRLAEPGGDSEAVTETATEQAAEEEPAPEVPTEGPPEIPVVVSLGGDASGINTEQSALFIFAHPAGAVGMPLAVQRIISPRFPISITLSDANVLQPGTSLASHEEVDISARLSMSGSANAGSGDVNAPAMTISPAGGESVKLVLDQVIP